MPSLSGIITHEGSCPDQDQTTEGEEDCQEANLTMLSLEANLTKANRGVSHKEASPSEGVREANHPTDPLVAIQTMKRNHL